MAYFYERKDSPFYWIRHLTGDGRMKSFSSGIRKDAPGAERKLQQRVADETAKERRLKSDGSNALFRTWVPGWIEHHYKNPLTAHRARNAWAHLSSYFKVRKVIHPEEVTYGICHDYMKWRTNEELAGKENRRVANWNTAITEIRILGTMMQEAVSRAWIIANPCSSLRLSRREAKEKSEITDEQQAHIERELATRPQWMQDAWVVGMKQGCRVVEVKVPLKRIDPANGVIAFLVKGGKFHGAPLHKDVLAVYLRRKSEGATYLVDLPANASRTWVRFFEEIGYDDLSFHCLRVTVITRLARAGVSESKCMEYVGHCSEAVHAIYRKLRPKDVASLGDHL